MDPQQLLFGTIYYAIKPDSFLYGINSLRSNYSEFTMLSEYIHGCRRSKSVPDFTIIPTRWDNVPEKYQKHEAVIFAKRFNIGNIDNEAYVIFLLPPKWSFMASGELVNYIDKFFLAVSDVTNTDSGDLIITPQPNILYDSKEETDYVEVCAQRDLDIPVPSFMPESTETKKRPKKLTRWLKKRIPGGLLEETDEASKPAAQPDILTQNEQKELFDIDREQRRALEELKQAVLNYVLTYHTDPSKIIQEHISGKFIVAPDKLSPIVVNSNTDIVLPHYDELNVKMPALHKAIYILFLNHHTDGIVLKDFDHYRDELMNIYSVVKPGRDEKLAKNTIDNLCNPLNNTLSEYISKINRCFKTVIKKQDIAENYCIKGKKGQAYKVNISPELLTLPSWVS